MFEQIKKLINEAVLNLTRRMFANGLQNPYKQFTFTIPDGETKSLFYDFNYFRILSISTTTGVTIRYGSSGTPSDVVGAGIGYEMPAIVNRAEIANNSGGVLTITVAAAIGRIDDDRLNISGSLSVAKPSQIVSTPDVTLVAATKTSILASNSTRDAVIIVNMDVSDAVRIGDTDTGAARGVKVDAGQSIEIKSTDEVFAYSAGTPTLSIIDTRD